MWMRKTCLMHSLSVDGPTISSSYQGKSGSLTLKESALTMLSIACAGEDWGFAGLLERKQTPKLKVLWYHSSNSQPDDEPDEPDESVKAWWFDAAQGSRASKRHGLYVGRPWRWGFWPFPFLSCLQSHESREEMLRVRDREAAWEMMWNDARWCRF